MPIVVGHLNVTPWGGPWLLGFAQRAVKVLRQFPDAANAGWYHFDFDEEVRFQYVYCTQSTVN